MRRPLSPGGDRDAPAKRAVVIDLTDGSLTAEEAYEQLERDLALYGDDKVPLANAATALAEARLDLPALYDGLTHLDNMPLAPQPRMATQLFPFQLQGLRWMQERDAGAGSSELLGGILGDEMGLGKTLQTIALVVSCPATARERAAGVTQTLVLCPLSCLQQWHDEIARHAPALRVLKYYGAARRKSVAALQSYDVLLSTYGTVSTALLERDGALRAHDTLRRINFLRIVLDEAHIIRTPRTRIHKAVMLLRGLNGALLRFLRHPDAHGDSWASFCKNTCKAVDAGDVDARLRLQSALKPLFLRRTKRTVINGEPIFRIPPARLVENATDFEGALRERLVYEAVKTRYSKAFSEYDHRGELAEHQAAIFTFILRLRQLCLHPLLWAFGRLRHMRDPDDKEKFLLQSPKRLVVADVMPHYLRLVDFLLSGALDAHDGRANQVVQRLLAVQIGDTQECCICLEEIGTAQLHVRTRCRHMFHEACMRLWLDEHHTCPMCRGPVDAATLNVVQLVQPHAVAAAPAATVEAWLRELDEAFVERYLFDFECAGFDTVAKLRTVRAADLDALGVDDAHRPAMEAALQRLGPAEEGEEEEGDAGEGERGDTFFFDTEQTVPPSTKLKLLIHALEATLASEGDAKILVFSQFTSFLDLVEDVMTRSPQLSTTFLRLDGSMPLKQRAANLSQFTTDPNKRVFLLSLKVSSLGLNLVAANHIFLLDPWWNPSVEFQAIDRCVRFGQQRPVVVCRFFIANSIEDRLREIQATKIGITNSVLNEDVESAFLISKVDTRSVRRLRRLFQ